MVVFTTGRGTPTGNAIAPVLKVTANERTFQMMEDNMDVDLSAVLRGEKTIQQMGMQLVDMVAKVANGRMTKAEAFGFSDIAVEIAWSAASSRRKRLTTTYLATPIIWKLPSYLP